MRVSRWNAPAWQLLGTSLNINAAGNIAGPSVIIDKGGAPVVVWIESGGIYVKRWSGTAWEQLGGILNRFGTLSGSTPSIAVDPSGCLWVSMTEGLSGTNIHVERQNRHRTP